MESTNGRENRNFAIDKEIKCNRSVLETPIETMSAFEWTHLNQNDWKCQGENDFDVKTRVVEHELTLCVSCGIKRAIKNSSLADLTSEWESVTHGKQSAL